MRTLAVVLVVALGCSGAQVDPDEPQTAAEKQRRDAEKSGEADRAGGMFGTTAQALGVPTIALSMPDCPALPKNVRTLPRLIDIEGMCKPVKSSPGRRMPSTVTRHVVGANTSRAYVVILPNGRRDSGV